MRPNKAVLLFDLVTSAEIWAGSRPEADWAEMFEMVRLKVGVTTDWLGFVAVTCVRVDAAVELSGGPKGCVVNRMHDPI